MKIKFVLGAFALLIVSQVNLFCKKELSCENCKENNKPPVAIAGPDQAINLPIDSFFLDGSSSHDTDGTINVWRWKKISGPASFHIIRPNDSITLVKSLIAGVYQFELAIIDNKGLSARDTIQIIVDVALLNHPPVAKAGPDQIIRLPINAVTLNGNESTDPDNNITAYVWTKISGPASFSITNASTVQTEATNLVEGTYEFELKVTDTDGLFSIDTIRIAVMNKPAACTDCEIVFVSNRDGNPEIYSCNADGSNILRLTYDVGFDGEPVWSPDRSRIAFISDRTGKVELYLMNADGSNVVRKTFLGAYSPVWSPDGTKIAYATLSNGTSNIWVVDVTTGTSRPIFEGPGWDSHPTWSPDGLKIAIVSDWAAFDFVYDVYTINVDGSGFTALTKDMLDRLDYLHPSWSPDSKKLAIVIQETTGINQYNARIGVMNSDGSGVKAIISGAAPDTKTCWSGDGTKIVYTSLSGSGVDVSWVSADGSASGTIVTNGWNADW